MLSILHKMLKMLQNLAHFERRFTTKFLPSNYNSYWNINRKLWEFPTSYKQDFSKWVAQIPGEIFNIFENAKDFMSSIVTN